MKISSSLSKAFTVLAIGFVALASTASADVLLVNTFGQGTADPGIDYGFTSPLSNGKSVAQQFKTVPVGVYPQSGYSFYNITGVSINMFRVSSGTGTLDLAIYSNVQGSTPNNKKDTPGTLVASLGTYTISGLSTTTSNVISVSNIQIPTKLNTAYWIVASVSGTGSVAFNTTTNSMSSNASNFSGFTPIATYINPPSQTSWYIEGSQDAYAINPIVMSVAVPEPSTYALGALSAIALGAIGRRKRLAKTVEQVATPETVV